MKYKNKNRNESFRGRYLAGNSLKAENPVGERPITSTKLRRVASMKPKIPSAISVKNVLLAEHQLKH